MTGRRRLLAAAAVSCLAAAPLAAQQASLRLGGVHARYADTLAGSAGAIGGRLAWETPSVRAVFDGTYARFTSGSYAMRLNGTALGVRVLRSGLGLGFRADADGDFLGGAVWGGTASAGPVIAVPTGRWLGVAGITAGAVRRIDETSDASFGVSTAIRRDLGALSLDAGLTGTRAGATRFADATLGVDYRATTFGLGATVGARTGDLSGDPWIQAQAEFRAAPWATLEAAAGTYPRDLTGFVSGVFISLGMRIGGGPRSFTTRAASGLDRGRGGPAREVQVEPVAERGARATFIVSDVKRVAIAGEWNAWTPVPLTPAGRNAWQVVLPLAPGVYRFSLVVDGDRWIVPAGVPTAPDDFGGSVGLLIVGGSRR